MKVRQPLQKVFGMWEEDIKHRGVNRFGVVNGFFSRYKLGGDPLRLIHIHTRVLVCVREVGSCTFMSEIHTKKQSDH